MSTIVISRYRKSIQRYKLLHEELHVMNLYIAVALGAVLFISVFLAKIYFVPGMITSGLFMTLVFVLAVIVVFIIASN